MYRSLGVNADWISTNENAFDEYITKSSEVVRWFCHAILILLYLKTLLLNRRWKLTINIAQANRVTAHSEILIDLINVIYHSASKIGCNSHRNIWSLSCVDTFRNKTGNENKENFFIKYRDTKHTDEYAFSRLTSNELELYLKSSECKYVIKDRILSDNWRKLERI